MYINKVHLVGVPSYQIDKDRHTCTYVLGQLKHPFPLYNYKLTNTDTVQGKLCDTQ